MKFLLDKIKQVYNSITNSKLSAKQPPPAFTANGNSAMTINSNGSVSLGTTTGTSTTFNTSGYTTTYTTWNTDAEDAAARKLKRRLWAIQHNKTWVHEMDDDMFDSVCGMLTSEIKADNEIAKEIIFNSKMCLRYRKHFANTFRRILEPTKFEQMGFKMTGGTYYTTSINPNYYTTNNPVQLTGTTYTTGGSGIINTVTTSGTTLIAKKACK